MPVHNERTTVLVTGHAGYIGTVLVGKLIERKYRVRGLDAGFFDEGALVPPRQPHEVIVKCVRDAEASDLRNVDAVIHLAALSNDSMGEVDPALTQEINYAASVKLATLARSVGATRFLFSSSCSIYGITSEIALTEDAALNPQTSYALSKVKVEEAVSALADDNFSPTFLRNGTAYGQSPMIRFDLVLNNLMGWATTTGEVRIMSDGKSWRPLVHVEDIAEAFIAAMEAPREAVHNQAINVGQERENYQVRDIAEVVSRTVAGSRVIYAMGASPDQRSYRVDFSKVRRLLPQFRPKWTIETGAQQLFEAIRLHRLALDDVTGRRFTRLKQLNHLLSSGAVSSDLRWKKTRDNVPAGGILGCDKPAYGRGKQGVPRFPRSTRRK